ncbi:amphi-Trp domain-containing protein [Halobacteriales archaeon QS_1_68_20]|nr:MAG: amphi-Trp domain-containing protein [Halobacteriales archaeon QS_1_68_20]
MPKEIEERDVTREEAAEQLESLADALRGEGSFDVEVRNRTVHLSPPSNVGMQLSVREESTMFRGDREGITVKFDWQPK